MSTESTQLAELVINVKSVPPERTVGEVADMFLRDEYNLLLSLPVVDGDKPVGVISRDKMMQVLFKQYGREIFGKKPITAVMNTAPVVIDAKMPLAEASKVVTERLKFPVTEDFIVTHDSRYLGMGAVMHLLRAMETQLAVQSRNLEAALKQLKASQLQLIQSEKMASLGQMVAGVAHEINTPLGYVKNNVEMLEMHFQNSAELLRSCGGLATALVSPKTTDQELQQRLGELAAMSGSLNAGDEADYFKLFEDTRFGIEQVSELVMNLKNFSRLDRAMTEDVNLNECVDSALMLARNVLKNKADVVKQYGELPRISCAPSQLNQVFLNMLTNAAQAMDEAGRILIKTEADDQWLRVVIQDTGKGIPADVLPKIFDPFFTTKPVGQGTGLGLSISYQIIQQHGGDIRVLSEVGKGTRFTILLPRADQGAREPKAA